MQSNQQYQQPQSNLNQNYMPQTEPEAEALDDKYDYLDFKENEAKLE